MKQIQIPGEQTQFICPATQESILNLEHGEFYPSEALLFCYSKSDGTFMDGSEWGELELKASKKAMKEKDVLYEDYEAFKLLLEQDYDDYPELVCYIVETNGGSPFNSTETLYFGIDMSYAKEDSKPIKLPEIKNEIHYSSKEITLDRYQVINADQDVVLTHMNTPFPELPETASQILVDDLNSIYNYNEAFHASGGAHSDELPQSFGYCIISTMEAYKNEAVPKLDITAQIQWDRLFRLSPGPPHLFSQLRATEQAREFLGEHWVDLPLNYCSSLEEMEADEIALVPEETVNTMSKLVDAMSSEEIIMVDILYNFFSYYSISMAIFWVADIVDDESFIAAYWTFYNTEDMFELEESEAKYAQFLMERLKYLKVLQSEYRMKKMSLLNNIKK